MEGDLDPDTPYLLRWWDPAVLGATGFGMVLELERQGYQVGVDGQFAAAALPHRVQPEETAGAVLYVVLGDGPIARARQVPGIEELGAYDVRTPAQRERSDELPRRSSRGWSRPARPTGCPCSTRSTGSPSCSSGPSRCRPRSTTQLDEYVALRQPAALFRAAPGTPVLPLG